MAKKQEQLTYMQLPLPQGQKQYKLTKVNWSGLNKRQTLDTGVLSMASNISTDEAPYLTPSQKRVVYKEGYTNPISLFGFDDFLFVVYRDDGKIKIDYIKNDSGKSTYTAELKESGATSADEKIQRSIVKFNLYDDVGDPISGSFEERYIVFPDKKAVYLDDSELKADDLEANGDNPIPDIKYATVHLSRLFGVDDDRVYASAFNDYANWDFDYAEYNESDAWVSPAQANTKANTAFTGITTFMNHVVCFKHNFMHEIYNNKNPFRIHDIFPEGAIDGRTVQEVNGRLIFVAMDGVKIYTGANPRNIGYNLNINRFSNAVSGADKRKYYLYTKVGFEHKLFVYDTFIDQWSEESIDFGVLGFAYNKNGMFLFGENGKVYRLDSGNYFHSWSFETDLFTGKTIDIKHIKKIQLFAEFLTTGSLEVYIVYDDEKFSYSGSHKVYSGRGLGLKAIRIVPRQTANYGFKLHFEGYGKIKLYGLEIFVTQGGELYV
ncbi:MAG: hypothetical protein M0R40_00655 [Firmicutes bacterium]|nr:hypothetical protein [Bacillota bacterium]